MPFPVNLKYIIETEQELGLVFPDSFKTKMMEENGGELETGDNDWQLFPFFDKSDKKRMGRTCNHIILETRQAQSWANFPGNGIAIASNGSGDLLILLPAKENSKKLGDEIFTWFHETGEIEKVADSIDELTPQISEPVKKTQLKNRFRILHRQSPITLDFNRNHFGQRIGLHFPDWQRNRLHRKLGNIVSGGTI